MCEASHVEIVFRDEYLTRADMWHLVMTEMAGRTVYKNMKIWSMRTIKASVKNVYLKGEKVESALFTASTKPIFRSESARYIMFIQMSKEMWDFDAGGSGQIMFSKAINGFLPELFKRWQHLNAKHIITVVLFTRIEYNKTQKGNTPDDIKRSGHRRGHDAADDSYKDFYRVVVSDMASGDWARILGQLKAEFKVFLRDVCICRAMPGNHFLLDSGFGRASTSETPDWVISGYPCSASRGNILEAINLASSQFSTDYIDRDLVRTGVSIAIITPGTGVFEVDYSLLLTTTNNLVANGIGIDLICLSRMPLHSVPLFKYRTPVSLDTGTAPLAQVTAWKHGAIHSCDTGFSLEKPSATACSDQGLQSPGGSLVTHSQSQWLYAIPHWIDVSFWTSALDEARVAISSQATSLNTSSSRWQPRKPFRPRVRMHELQMMGIMEDAMGEIAIPYLPSISISRYPTSDARNRPKDSQGEKGSLEELSRASISQASSHLSRMCASSQERKDNSSGSRDLAHIMVEYDESVFTNPNDTTSATRKANKDSQKISKINDLGRVKKASSQSRALDFRHPSHEQTGFEDELSCENPPETFGQRSKKSIAVSTSSAIPKSGLHPPPARFSRQISFGLRGFGATTPKATASTELFAEHAKSPSLLARTPRSHELSSPEDSVTRGKEKHVLIGDDKSGNRQESSIARSEVSPSLVLKPPTLSRPIPIRKNTAIRIFDGNSAVHGRTNDGPARAPSRREDDRDNTVTMATTRTGQQEADIIPRAESKDDFSIPSPVNPQAGASTAWMTILNPCNPSQTRFDGANRLGRWQHVFPRPLRASKIKWKSLCSPAAVPITTEEFPSTDQLASHYQHSSYLIAAGTDDELSEDTWSRDSLMREMVAIRLSHGFQIVTGPVVAQSSRSPANQRRDVFDINSLKREDLIIHLSKSSVIHQLRYTGSGEIGIKCFMRRDTTKQAEGATLPPSTLYKPAIRTMLAKEYLPQDIQLYHIGENHDWHRLDVYLGETRKHQLLNVPAALRFWRARFVLIPVDPPTNTRRPLQSPSGDSEEEMRLEGIQRLTQIWQKFRYVSPEERRFQVALRQRKDTNPLDIMYQTRNPSAIVAAERENMGESLSASGAVELLPDSELYQRSNLNLASLAQTMQSNKGVGMVDRRWHWRLYYNCFIGFELTTWLLQNFRDIDTREEAVELGNELMKNGLFQHVEQRHNFRDGNYFYQIASDYWTPRPESRSWFGTTRKPMPPTPISEAPAKLLSNVPASRPSSKAGEDPEANDPIPLNGEQRLGVALSKALLYDVDHRRRSYRRELITLHYDRLHNPDNCYHIRIEWMNVTSKLIEDAIVSWATTVDRYGLKLVQMPLAEASAITNMHPFGGPYLVRLARPPPSQQPQTLAYSDAKSFGPHNTNDAHLYQKAILKKFRFILDLEAASDFPSDVDVAYSWGAPDYRYAQYIHQSGVLLVQITEEGHFLLLANRLYSNRNMAAQETAPDTADPKYRSISYRGSPRASPFSSPIVGPTTDVPVSGHQDSKPGSATPEQLKCEFESFCQDATALEAFFHETLHTPEVPRRYTPYTENSIPTLGLTPSLPLRNKASASKIGRTINSGAKKTDPTSNDADSAKGD